jgi:hypothetical protein
LDFRIHNEEFLETPFALRPPIGYLGTSVIILSSVHVAIVA